jgi:hypothetical protein
MPARPFKVHVDPDALVRQDLAGAVSLPPPPGKDADERGGADGVTEQHHGKDADEPGGADGVTEQHHGARDGRLAARQQSERARAGRASGTGGGRSYAFRRS